MDEYVNILFQTKTYTAITETFKITTIQTTINLNITYKQFEQNTT